MIIANTLARNAAAFDLRRAQFKEDENVVNLNPKGRRQNKKFRPTVLVTPTLRRWLESETAPDAYYITFEGKPIKSVRTAWNNAARDAGLPKGFTPYSFRHGIAREMKTRRVPRDQISYYLGHENKATSKTTLTYAPMDAHDCPEAAKAIEAVMDEIRKLVKTANLDDPAALSAGDVEGRVGHHLSVEKRTELAELVKAGVGVMEICRRVGVSNPLVYRYRKRLIGRTRIDRKRACQSRALTRGKK